MWEVWREGHGDTALEWVRQKMDDVDWWESIEADQKAELLRFRSRLEVDVAGDLALAIDLADNADALAIKAKDLRLNAFLLRAQGTPALALTVLEVATSADDLNVKVALLMESGQLDEAENILADM